MMIEDAAGARPLEVKDESEFPLVPGSAVVVFFNGVDRALLNPMEMLSSSSRESASRFASEARRRQSAWARVLLLAACRAAGIDQARLVESPPGPPIVEFSGGTLSSSIAHCRGAAAVVIDTAPCGIDVEALRSIPRKVEKLDFFMPRAADSVKKACLKDDAFFLALWGAWEASIKSGRPLRPSGAALSADGDRLDFILMDGFLITTRTNGSAPPSIVRYEDLVTNE